MFDKRKRNKLVELIKSTRLEPNEFEIILNPDESVKITYANGNYYFLIIPGTRSVMIQGGVRQLEGVRVQYVPTQISEKISFKENFFKSPFIEEWPEVFKLMESWLKELKADIDTPDLWAEEQIVSVFNGFIKIEQVPEEPFSSEEYSLLLRQLKEFRKKVPELGLPDKAAKAIQQTIDQSPEKASNSSKREFAKWFFQTIGSAVLSAELSHEHLKTVVEALASAFTSSFHYISSSLSLF